MPGHLNPADLSSRGCGAKHLVESRWWEGPKWLKLSKDQWPSSNEENEAEINNEIKKSALKNKKTSLKDTVAVNTSLIVTQEDIGWYMKGQSSYCRIVRTIAWIRRFIANCKAQVTERLSGELTMEEFIDAELIVLKFSQEESFKKTGKPRLSTLDTYKDEKGLTRLKSLVSNREDEHGFRYPIVLNPKHTLVKKLIEYKHQQLNHWVFKLQ